MAGAGPIGLLAAFVLRDMGLETYAAAQSASLYGGYEPYKIFYADL